MSIKWFPSSSGLILNYAGKHYIRIHYKLAQIAIEHMIWMSNYISQFQMVVISCQYPNLKIGFAYLSWYKTCDTVQIASISKRVRVEMDFLVQVFPFKYKPYLYNWIAYTWKEIFTFNWTPGFYTALYAHTLGWSWSHNHTPVHPGRFRHTHHHPYHHKSKSLCWRLPTVKIKIKYS